MSGYSVWRYTCKIADETFVASSLGRNFVASWPIYCNKEYTILGTTYFFDKIYYYVIELKSFDQKVII